MSSSNQYAKNARKKSLLGSITEVQETKGDLKASAIESVKDLLIGAIGGGLIGAAIGRPSLGVGLAVSIYGNYTENRLLTSMGLGMMASGGYQAAGGVNGTETTGIAGVKERVEAFKVNVKDRLYLDKIIKKKPESGESVGEVQYFSYPEAARLGEGDVDMSALDELERQISQSAGNYQSANSNLLSGLSGAEYDFEKVNY